MTYEKTDEFHACELPDASGFKHGDVISCTEAILSYGRIDECGKKWQYSTTFWQKTPQWRAFDWGW